MLDPARLRPRRGEAVRPPRADLRHVGDGDVRTVVVTSAEPDSGKTTVATGLAAAAAHAHPPALLIEAAPPPPRLRKLLGTGAEGLVPLLRGEGSDLEGAVAHV